MDNNYLVTKMSGSGDKDASNCGAKRAISTWAACVNFAEQLKYLKPKQAEELKKKFKEGMDQHYAAADAEYKAALEKAKAEKPPKASTKAADMAAMEAKVAAMEAKLAKLEGAGGK